MTEVPDITATLPRGLTSSTVDAMAALVGEIAARPLAAPPWLAPALLFADPDLQVRLDLPRPGPDEVLIHEHQSLEIAAPLPLDTPLTAAVTTKRDAGMADYRFTLSDAVTLGTVLRLFPLAALADAEPAPFRPQMLKDTAVSGAFAITQAQTDRYLALSGDGNPIHSDPEAARALGLSAPVVPGVLLLSLVQPAVEAAFPGARLAMLKCRFMAPLEMGDPFRIALQKRNEGRVRAFLLGAADRALALADVRLG